LRGIKPCGALADIISHAKLRRLLRDLDHELHRQLPHAHKLSPARLALSFNAQFADLDPIYAYYIQGRALPTLHMPLRYTRVCATHLTRAYLDHTQSFVEGLVGTVDSLATVRGLPNCPWLQSDFPSIGDSIPNDSGNLAWGSWRCARPESMRQLLEALHDRDVTLHTFVAFCALTGARPFEPLTIERHCLSEEGSLIAIRGKPNVAHPSYRTVPVPISLRPALLALKATNNTWLFERPDGSPFSLADANAAITENLNCAYGHRCATPDLYSLRHAYRSSLLAAGVPFADANYLMGHQTEGTCIYDPYLDRPVPSLTNVLRPALQMLEKAYGIWPTSA
jgi:hypothetical protein